MTEKRFTWNSKEVVIDDNVTGNQLEVIDITEIDVLIDLLNELHEEKEQLEKENNELKKENEQLKKENYGLYKRLGDFEPFERYMKERTSKTPVNIYYWIG